MSVNSETQTSGRPRRSRVSRVRKAVLAIAFALFCAGVVVAGGLGDACSVGYEAIAAVCPLGALEGFFGSWSFAPRMAIGLGLALVVVIVAGRAFCSWICPVGLTFATVIAFYRFVGFNEPTFDLLVFPAIIVVELVLLRKWCHRFCPIGALMSLFAPLARRLRPQVKVDACLRSTGEDCVVCGSVCPEGIDPVRDLGRRPLYECTRCGRCAEVCPTQAITFRRRRARSTDPVMIDDGQAVLLD